jgi:hypothetical protein
MAVCHSTFVLRQIKLNPADPSIPVRGDATAPCCNKFSISRSEKNYSKLSRLCSINSIKINAVKLQYVLEA